MIIGTIFTNIGKNNKRMSSTSTPIERLVKQAREDPQFFHDLVFNTEKALGKIDYLDLGKVERRCAVTCWGSCDTDIYKDC
jgi:hypothetical protein